MPHRLLSAPLALSANVFSSLPRSQFTVKGLALSTVLFNCFKGFKGFKGLAVFRDFIAPRRWPWGVAVHIDVIGGFEAVFGWKLDGRTKTTRDKNLKAYQHRYQWHSEHSVLQYSFDWFLYLLRYYSLLIVTRRSYHHICVISSIIIATQSKSKEHISVWVKKYNLRV